MEIISWIFIICCETEIPYDIFSVSLMLRSCLNQTDDVAKAKLWIIL